MDELDETLKRIRQPSKKIDDDGMSESDDRPEADKDKGDSEVPKRN